MSTSFSTRAHPLTVCLLFLSSLMLRPAAAQFTGMQAQSPPPASTVQEAVDRFHRSDAPGASIAVIRGDKIDYLGAFGLANLDSGEPLSVRTPVPLASLSKQITGFAVAMLVEEGLIDADEDVRRYVPELPEFEHPVRVRHLLHHTSGLREEMGMLRLAGTGPEDSVRRSDVLEMVSRLRYLEFTPGTRYAYRNTNYTLLAEIVSRVSGMPFEQWVQTRLFEPLGMTDAGFVTDVEGTGPIPAVGYESSPGGYEKSGFRWEVVGSGGIHASAADMAKWAVNLQTGAVGGQAVLRRIMTEGHLNDGEEIAYGIGFIYENERGLPTWAHGGMTPGLQTGLRTYIDHDLTIVILSNTGPAGLPMARMALQTADVFLHEEFAAAAEAAPQRPPLMLTREFIDSVPEGSDALTAEQYEQYRGTYRLAVDEELRDDLLLGRPVVVSTDGRRLLAAFGEPPGLPLRPLGDHRFHLDRMEFGFTFEMQPDGRATEMTLHLTEDSFGGLGERNFRGVRLDDSEPSPSELQRLAGTYHGPELDTSYEVVLDDGRLEIHHPVVGRVPLERLSRYEYLADSDVFTSVTFLPSGNGHVTGLRMIGYSWGTETTLEKVD